MHIQFRRFIRHKDSILRQFEELNNSKSRMWEIGKFICKIMREGDYELAYHNLTVDVDRLRHTEYGDILRKYNIYTTFEKDKKKQKYERMCAFKNIGNYRELLFWYERLGRAELLL